MAYHLTRKWAKERILRNYLNTIYFGNGAYGIEAAARTYFGANHPRLRRGHGQRTCAALARAPRGRAARRRSSPPRARYDPIANPRGRQGAPRPRAAAHARAGLPHRARSTSDALAEPLPDARGPPAAGRGHRVPVLHRPGSSSRWSTSSAAARRARALRGRPADPHDDRPRAPGGRATGGRRLAAERRRPARRARGDRQPAPARCARWSAATTTTSAPFNLATQGQRQPGSAFKPFMLAEALRPGHPPTRPGRRRRRVCDVDEVAVRGASTSTTTRTPTPASRRWPTRRRSPTTRSSPSSASRSGRKQDRRGSPAHGHPHAGLDQLRDDARRPRAGRHAARHGARLRDLRHRRQAASTARSARAPTTDARDGAVPGPVGIKRDRPRRRTTSSSRSSCRAARRRSTERGRAGPRRGRRREVALAAAGRRRGSAPASARRSATCRRRQDRARPRTTATPGSSAGREKYTVAVWVGYPDKVKPMEPSSRASRSPAAPTRPAILQDLHGVARSNLDPRRRRGRDDGAGRADRPPATGTAGADAPRRPRRPTARAGDRAATAAPTGADAPAPEPAQPTAAPRRRRAEEAPAPAQRAGAARRRRRAAAPATGGGRRARADGERRRSAQAATGATRCATPAAQKRHGSSAALVIPIARAGHASTASQLAARRGSIADRAADEVARR